MVLWPALQKVRHCVIARFVWQGVSELMLMSANKLAQSSADFLICSDNTIHQALPWLHIADVVAASALARGFHRIGLTGTPWLVDSEVYPENSLPKAWHIIDSAMLKNEINRIIMEELVNGVQTSEAILYFQALIAKMKTNGCDAV